MTRKSVLAQSRSRNDLDRNVIVDNHVLTKKNKRSLLKVLLIEDSLVLAPILRQLLQREGYKVDIADSAESALAQFKIGKYRFILMNIRLPDISGFETTKRIRELEGDTASRTPIIAFQDKLIWLNA